MRRLAAWLVVLAVGVASGIVGCSSAKVTPTGGLMVVVTSDGSLPALTQLRIAVTSVDGANTYRSAEYSMPDEATLPTTLAIASNGSATAAVAVHVSVWGGGTAYDVRDRQIYEVPTDRVAELDVVLSAKCTRWVQMAGGMATSACPAGQTCEPATGACVGKAGHGAELATYGGSTDDGGVDADSRGDSAPGDAGEGCSISGATYAAGATKAGDVCQTCQPAMSGTVWSAASDGTPCGTHGVCHAGSCVSGCEIGGVYYASGQVHDANACEVCSPTASTEQWTARTGVDCGAVDGGALCDGSVEPRDAPGCVVNGWGVFVDGRVGDARIANGTKERPYNSIGAAVAAAKGGRVFVCAGAYAEEVVLDAGHDVQIYGGWGCGDWTYSTGNIVTVSGVNGGALKIKGTSGTVIEDVAFEVGDASAAGGSSVAGLISGAKGEVRLTRVKLTAGAGKAGGAGAIGGNYSGAAPGGGGPVGATGGEAVVNHCVNGATSTGGGGGSGAAEAGTISGGNGEWSPEGTIETGYSGVGGGGGTTNCGMGPKAGSNGAPATTVGAGATRWGTLSADGWTPVNGAAGAAGNPGQGGGGGGGETSVTTGGGGGGPGGCGGGGGGGGQAGGSSFALLVYQSSVTLTACTLKAGDAGAGGKGGDGQVGQTGGVGFGGYYCAGAMGGNGAGGGGGGGGAGGVSAAIGYVGTAPVRVGTAMIRSMTTAAGAGPGRGDNGGGSGTAHQAGKGPDGTAGVAGAVGDVLAL